VYSLGPLVSFHQSRCMAKQTERLIFVRWFHAIAHFAAPFCNGRADQPDNTQLCLGRARRPRNTFAFGILVGHIYI
jgi:hypothetical protein